MKMVRSNFTIPVLMLAALFAAACGGNASMSPVGPSSSSSSGASISGTISGTPVATRALEAGSFSLLDSRSVTITVVGTGISTAANNQGQFTLDNVPPGTVTLNFTGPGSNATVTLTGVGAGDKVQITVTVNGNSAHVDSEHHTSPDNSKGEFQGRIIAIDATAKSFTVSGMTVKITTTTVIRHGNKTLQFTDLKVGDHVQVRGTRDATTITATEVKVETDDGDDQGEDDDRGNAGQVDVSGVVSASSGTCPAVTLKVNTTSVTVNNATVYSHTTCADATKNGAKVEVQGTRQTDGSILATRVEIDD